MKSLEDRFWGRVNKTDECWLWSGPLHPVTKYAPFAVTHTKQRLAHRVAWLLTNGPIPSGMNVLHRCDVRHCVNPDHLFLGTDADNMQDAAAKGRMTKGIRNSKAKLSEKDVLEIRTFNEPLRTLGRRYGVHNTVIGDVKTRKTWRHVP